MGKPKNETPDFRAGSPVWIRKMDPDPGWESNAARRADHRRNLSAVGR